MTLAQNLVAQCHKVSRCVEFGTVAAREGNTKLARMAAKDGGHAIGEICWIIVELLADDVIATEDAERILEQVNRQGEDLIKAVLVAQWRRDEETERLVSQAYLDAEGKPEIWA